MLDFCSLRYVTMISDGDCRNHASVVELKPYGDIAIEKEESMKMGRPLEGKTVTDKKMDIFQKYYGEAIHSHKQNKEGMRAAIWAMLYHSASSDENPQHAFCPGGEDSWCGWQRDQAKGTTVTNTGLPWPLL